MILSHHGLNGIGKRITNSHTRHDQPFGAGEGALPSGFAGVSICAVARWPSIPRGSGVQRCRDRNSLECRIFFAFVQKRCGFRSDVHQPSPRMPMRCHPDRGRLSADEGSAFLFLARSGRRIIDAKSLPRARRNSCCSGFTLSERRGTVLCRSSCARNPRLLFLADMFRSSDARRLVRRSAGCLPRRRVFRKPSLGSFGFR